MIQFRRTFLSFDSSCFCFLIILTISMYGQSVHTDIVKQPNSKTRILSDFGSVMSALNGWKSSSSSPALRMSGQAYNHHVHGPEYGLDFPPVCPMVKDHTEITFNANSGEIDPFGLPCLLEMHWSLDDAPDFERVHCKRKYQLHGFTDWVCSGTPALPSRYTMEYSIDCIDVSPTGELSSECFDIKYITNPVWLQGRNTIIENNLGNDVGRDVVTNGPLKPGHYCHMRYTIGVNPVWIYSQYVIIGYIAITTFMTGIGFLVAVSCATIVTNIFYCASVYSITGVSFVAVRYSDHLSNANIIWIVAIDGLILMIMNLFWLIPMVIESTRWYGICLRKLLKKKSKKKRTYTRRKNIKDNNFVCSGDLIRGACYKPGFCHENSHASDSSDDDDDDDDEETLRYYLRGSKNRKRDIEQQQQQQQQSLASSEHRIPLNDGDDNDTDKLSSYIANAKMAESWGFEVRPRKKLAETLSLLDIKDSTMTPLTNIDHNDKFQHTHECDDDYEEEEVPEEYNANMEHKQSVNNSKENVDNTKEY